MSILLRLLPAAVVLLLPSLALAAEEVEEISGLAGWAREFAPIAILLAVVTFVLARLPNVEDVTHDKAFKTRRVMNWLPLGLTYAFLYMGRYNLKVSKFAFEEMKGPDGTALMGNEDFGLIFMFGTIVYGCSFLINGPLTDRLGGKFSILMGAGGSAVMNLLMGMGALTLLNEGPLHNFVGAHFVVVYSILYSLNMYFQSFGAVAIVKVNAPWFHVRERGVFGAIFGILISLGVYFAFDWGYLILEHLGLAWVFLMPTILLAIFWVIDWRIVRNTPGEAGVTDFDTEDASSGMAEEVDDDALWAKIQDTVTSVGLPALDPRPRVKATLIVATRVYWVFVSMLTNPIVLTIAAIEFCSGFLRQAIMQWYRTFAKQTDMALHLKGDFVYENWGLLLCCAGIMGGVFAGIISDHVFQSRRGPVAGILYLGMLIMAIVLTFTYDTQIVGWLVIGMSMCVIGVHGMLSGTASMDFGGKKNVGIAVGVIDGFVYLGTAVMSGTYAIILPREQFDSTGALTGPVTDPANWIGWPVAMIPMAAIGAILATRIWNAKPRGGGGGH